MSIGETPTSWRLFWAVPCVATPELAHALTDLERWQGLLKITPPEQLHLTLKFLGDTPTERVEEIVAAGRKLDLSAVRSPLACRGVGVFPPRGRPNVIWAGLSGGDALVHVASRLDDAMTELGYAPERRAFHPHLTLARVKGVAPRPLLNWLQTQLDADFGPVDICELVLFRSELTPQRAVYTPVFALPLSS
jgi:2'-5' RNA ligase